MNTTSTSTTYFSDTPSAEEGIERPFRPSSLVCLLLGLLSLAVTTTPKLVFIPIVAIALGVYALRPSGDPHVRPAGRSLAIGGIFLALFFASWGITYFSIRHQRLTRSAEVFALDWLDLLYRGEKEIALELTQPPSMRQVSSMRLSEFYSPMNQSAYQLLDGFLSGTAVKAIVAAKTQPVWVYEDTYLIDRRFGHEYVVLTFRDSTGQIPPIKISMCRSPRLDKQREYDYSMPREWSVPQLSLASAY